MRHPDRHRGFSLLEAIVALALLGSVGIALFSWVNTSLGSLVRVEEAIERRAAKRMALEYLGTVNPMLQASGSVQFGDVTISWQATPIEGPVNGIAYLGLTLSQYELALYETEAEIQRGTAPVSSFSLRQVGYRRVRGYDLETQEG